MHVYQKYPFYLITFPYYRLNRLQESVNSYTEALKFDPFFKEAFIGRGNTLMDYSHNSTTHHARLEITSFWFPSSAPG